MYLDAVSRTKETTIYETNGSISHPVRPVFAKWEQWQPSQISHHGKLCCEISREWITATDYSALSGGNLFTGPRWLREKFNWGASSFPIYWCEAVRKKTLDCGALAALAHEVFKARGVNSYRVQLVQRFSEVATSQWSCNWSENGDTELRWIDGDLIYHEGCAIETSDREIRVWDASAGWWIDAKPRGGYGALLAIRLSGETPASLNWSGQTIRPNKWIVME